MAAGHGTWAGVGGGVVTLGAFPGGFGIYEVIGSGHGPWGNAWFDVGAALWAVGAIVLGATAVHLVYEWRKKRGGGGGVAPTAPTAPASPGSTFNVTSRDQQGGVTAGQYIEGGPKGRSS
jgi:hypothetical protein